MRLLTGSEPSAACGRYSEAENGQGQRALQASARAMRPCPNLRSLVRVQQGEPKAKHRFTRCFVFVFREDVGQRRCGAAVSRLLTGSEPSAACGRYSEAENGQGQRGVERAGTASIASARARDATMSQPAVVGSSPTGGAKHKRMSLASVFVLCFSHSLVDSKPR